MKSSKLWCQADGVFGGIVYAGLIGLLGIFESGPVADDLWLRMLIGFALGVCAKPAVDGAVIELASDTPPRFGRLHLGIALGSTWALAMILAFWPLQRFEVVIWAVAGVWFGSFMAKMHKVEPIAANRLKIYDLSKNLYANYDPFWRVVLSIGAVVVFCGLILLIAWDEKTPPYLVFGIIVVGLNKAVPYAYKFGRFKAFQFFVSTAALVAGYLAI
jgi:hypothetical protein